MSIKPSSTSEIPEYTPWSMSFEDGNVLLIAKAPEKDLPTGFRVHASMLILHSAKFSKILKDKLGLEDDEELHKIDWTGCELYINLDDHPQDVSYWLAAMYDGLHFPWVEERKLAIIRGVILLSRKYETEDLYEAAYHILSTDYPSRASAWGDRERRCRTSSNEMVHPLRAYANPIHAIRLFRELGLPELLPAALYDLSRWPVSAIFAGVVPLPGGLHIPREDPNVVRISDLDFSTVIGLKDWMQRYTREFLRIYLDDRKDEILQFCEDPTDPNCSFVFSYVLDNIMRHYIGLPGGEKFRRADRTMFDPFIILERVWVAVRQKESDIQIAESIPEEGAEVETTVCCEGCAVYLRNACLIARNELWTKMTTWVQDREEAGVRPPPMFQI